MAAGATLALKITGDASDARKALRDVDDSADKTGGKFKGMGGAIAGGLAAAGAAIGGLAFAAFNAASDLQQSTGAIESVFGDWAIDIEQSAQKAAGSVGISASAYQNLAAVLGAQLKGAGLPIDEVTSKTQGLIEKGADLAATFGGTTADAVSALSSVLKGETDPIERYGVSLKQSDINARLAALGQDNLTGSALKTATANAALGLVMEQTKDTSGAFGRELDTAAGSGAVLSAKFEDLKAKLGEGLLPIFATVATFISEQAIPAFERATAEGGFLREAFDKITAFVQAEVLPMLTRLWDYLSANLVPILKTVAGFLLDNVVPAFKTLWSFVKDYVIPFFATALSPVLGGIRDVFEKVAEKVNDNRDKFQGLYEKVQPFLAFMRDQVAPFISTVLTKAFQTLSAVLGPVIDTLAWILDKGAAAIGLIGKVGGAIFGAPAPAGGGGARAAAPLRGAAPGMFGASVSSGGGGAGPGAPTGGLTLGRGDTYNITISGVLDGADAADKIARLLERRDRMHGRISAGAFA